MLKTFPDYQDWLDVLARRDQGVYLVALLALCAVAWLVVARFQMPRLFPAVRWLGVAGFWLMLLIACAIQSPQDYAGGAVLGALMCLCVVAAEMIGGNK